MWLLRTDRAELEFFPTPESVPAPGYAILSHVWIPDGIGKEQTFQETNNHRLACESTGKNPRDLATTKIKEFCKLAERHGYRWVWVDTCCIDKSSSSELSEAINSMYRYYALADVCYAYLKDVPYDCDVKQNRSAFRTSRWHGRGWTLQELIAPEIVVFVADGPDELGWLVLGSKADLADTLQEITNIPADVLRMEREVTDVGIAARMSWASRRKTTRPEDEAYCLMGIFGVYMSTLYGEGRNAFRRLQEEIMKHTVDTSIFAWGGYSDERGEDGYFATRRRHIDTSRCGCYALDDASLFAVSPIDFQRCSGRRSMRRFLSGSSLGRALIDDLVRVNQLRLFHGTNGVLSKDRTVEPSRGDAQPSSSASDMTGIPSFTITPYGILAHLPVIRTSRISIAVLYSAQDDVQLGLHLQRCSHSIDPLRPLYHLSQTRLPPSKDSNAEITVRLIGFSETRSPSTFRMFGEEVTAEWKSIYLINRAPQASISDPPRIPMNRSVFTPFRLSRGLVEELQRHTDVPLLPHSIRSGAMLQFPWKGSPPAVLQFSVKLGERRNWFSGDSNMQYGIVEVRLGCCENTMPSCKGRPPKLGKHWANVRAVLDADSPFNSRMAEDERLVPSHDCSEDHICDWPMNPKTLTLLLAGIAVDMELSLTPCRMNPEGTLDVNIRASLRS